MIAMSLLCLCQVWLVILCSLLSHQTFFKLWSIQSRHKGFSVIFTQKRRSWLGRMSQDCLRLRKHFSIWNSRKCSSKLPVRKCMSGSQQRAREKSLLSAPTTGTKHTTRTSKSGLVSTLAARSKWGLSGANSCSTKWGTGSVATSRALPTTRLAETPPEKLRL